MVYYMERLMLKRDMASIVATHTPTLPKMVEELEALRD